MEEVAALMPIPAIHKNRTVEISQKAQNAMTSSSHASKAWRFAARISASRTDLPSFLPSFLPSKVFATSLCRDRREMVPSLVLCQNER